MSADELLAIQDLIDSAMSSLKTARSMLASATGTHDASRMRYAARAGEISSSEAGGKVIEGIFDGQNMIDEVGQSYPVPANYASKSKLVEGDGMKLTITDEGKFVYKQIRPVERKNVVGVLIQEDGQYKILAEGRTFRVLLASVTFYRAEVGDQVTIILPAVGDAKWGAVDAVIPKSFSNAEAQSVFAGHMSDGDGELKPALADDDDKS